MWCFEVNLHMIPLRLGVDVWWQEGPLGLNGDSYTGRRRPSVTCPRCADIHTECYAHRKVHHISKDAHSYNYMNMIQKKTDKASNTHIKTHRSFQPPPPAQNYKKITPHYKKMCWRPGPGFWCCGHACDCMMCIAGLHIDRFLTWKVLYSASCNTIDHLDNIEELQSARCNTIDHLGNIEEWLESGLLCPPQPLCPPPD